LPFLLLVIIRSGSRTAILTIVVALFSWFVLKVYFAENRRASCYSILRKSLPLSIATITLVLLLGSVIDIVASLPEAIAQEEGETINSKINYNATDLIKEHVKLNSIAVSLESRILATNESSVSNLGGRVSLWKGFAELIEGGLIIGYGYSGYLDLSEDFFGFVESPHNVILEVMMYSGVLGLFAYLAFIGLILYNAVRVARDHEDFFGVVLFCSVFLGFSLGFQSLSEKICWLLLAYINSSYVSYNLKPK
jgi:O-antigen ligase